MRNTRGLGAWLAFWGGAVGAACAPSPNVNVSAPVDVPAAGFSIQNETRMARASRGNGLTRLLAVYNDDTQALVQLDGGTPDGGPDAGLWDFVQGSSIKGIAWSENEGITWH